MIYIRKQKGLYQNKVNSSVVFICDCKMAHSCDSYQWCMVILQCDNMRHHILKSASH